MRADELILHGNNRRTVLRDSLLVEQKPACLRGDPVQNVALGI